VNIAKHSVRFVRFLRLRRAVGLAVLCLSISAGRSVAHAFADPLYFAKSADEGGGGGRWFTGSPADGYGCGVCHLPNQAEKLVVEGLPKNGYVPDKDYYIRIAWPETAARTHALYDLPPPAVLPRTSLVAELIAETAESFGQVHGGWPDPGTDFSPGSLGRSAEAELCHRTPEQKAMGKNRRFGYTLFRQSYSDRETREPQSVGACEGSNLTRCLIAVRGCGSEELRFTWRAPKKTQGAIWFSASFVTTDQQSLSPEGDAVSEITIPIPPAGSQGYEATLDQSCSLVRGPAAQRRSGLGVAAFVGLCLVLVRRQQSRRLRGRGGRA
jgi:hypothetical protein